MMMNTRQEIMVAMGAAIGANCIPCFDFVYSKAKEAALSDQEIAKTIETAFKVKNGASIFLKSAVRDVTGQVPGDQEVCCEALGDSNCGCG
jgi:4-carboxymuconolactone decarboxylase